MNPSGPTVAVDGSRPLRGELRPVGDKSITHRALLFNAVADGTATVHGGNPGADARSTASCLRALGVRIDEEGTGAWTVHGRGFRLRPATDALDCGNSGTTMRLLAGVCAGQPFTSTLDGDASLGRRPMERVAVPLRAMGARVEGPTNGARPPLVITGPVHRGGRFEIRVASAQVKSCLLLAGLLSGRAVEVVEPGASRDHTERMLAAMGAPIDAAPGHAAVGATRALRALDVDVPADPSSAALVAAVVAVTPHSRVTFSHVLCNSTRTGFVETLRAAGAGADWGAPREHAGETTADLTVEAAPVWTPLHVEATVVPSLIDEVPALVACAAFAPGTSVFDGVAELRVKESDRVASMQALLGVFGVDSESTDDRLVVHGGGPRRPTAALPATDDHRIAMAATVLAAGVSARDGAGPITVDLTAAAVSHPGFGHDLEGLRA
ncbi:MAG TPA: 3-phosphoshikimate 1-carboxyvinyltransferase [Candidatus Krumholzibacteria bacterium]|nr:3-phosphoshikimate 1-carboxyvinyltransferase [Candidatus Krumholzibacteria bacterium]